MNAKIHGKNKELWTWHTDNIVIAFYYQPLEVE